MKLLDRLVRLAARFRYPVTLPEDVVETLGVTVSNFLSFDELTSLLNSSTCSPQRLAKFMPRREAEDAFKHATRKEVFREKTLISYYFCEGWIQFHLHFDDQSRLRRIYLRHKNLEVEEGIEISLCCSYIGKRAPVHVHRLKQTLSTSS